MIILGFAEIRWYFLMLKKSYTLYHGTIKDHKDSISQVGLISNFGDFVKEYYSDYIKNEDDAAIVFAADKKHLAAALNAMHFHIAKKLNIDFHDVREEHIKEHGLLAIIKDGDQIFSQRPEDEMEWGKIQYEHDLPMTIEPNDWYSNAFTIMPDIILTGSKLIQFLKQNNLLYSPTKTMQEKYIKEEKQKMLNKKDEPQLELFPRTIEEIKNKAKTLSNNKRSNVLNNIENINKIASRPIQLQKDFINEIIASFMNYFIKHVKNENIEPQIFINEDLYSVNKLNSAFQNFKKSYKFSDKNIKNNDIEINVTISINPSKKDMFAARAFISEEDKKKIDKQHIKEIYGLIKIEFGQETFDNLKYDFNYRDMSSSAIAKFIYNYLKSKLYTIFSHELTHCIDIINFESLAQKKYEKFIKQYDKQNLFNEDSKEYLNYEEFYITTREEIKAFINETIAEAEQYIKKHGKDIAYLHDFETFFKKIPIYKAVMLALQSKDSDETAIFPGGSLKKRKAVAKNKYLNALLEWWKCINEEKDCDLKIKEYIGKFSFISNNSIKRAIRDTVIKKAEAPIKINNEIINTITNSFITDFSFYLKENNMTFADTNEGKFLDVKFKQEYEFEQENVVGDMIRTKIFIVVDPNQETRFLAAPVNEKINIYIIIGKEAIANIIKNSTRYRTTKQNRLFQFLFEKIVKEFLIHEVTHVAHFPIPEHVYKITDKLSATALRKFINGDISSLTKEEVLAAKFYFTTKEEIKSYLNQTIIETENNMTAYNDAINMIKTNSFKEFFNRMSPTYNMIMKHLEIQPGDELIEYPQGKLITRKQNARQMFINGLYDWWVKKKESLEPKEEKITFKKRLKQKIEEDNNNAKYL